eukprot:1620130-Pyramimonas_sp.AAC.1
MSGFDRRTWHVHAPRTCAIQVDHCLGVCACTRNAREHHSSVPAPTIWQFLQTPVSRAPPRAPERAPRNPSAQ